MGFARWSAGRYIRHRRIQRREVRRENRLRERRCLQTRIYNSEWRYPLFANFAPIGYFKLALRPGKNSDFLARRIPPSAPRIAILSFCYFLNTIHP